MKNNTEQRTAKMARMMARTIEALRKTDPAAAAALSQAAQGVADEIRAGRL